ncbi:MAG: DUF5916 domain-containing protein [bacterium]
MPRLAFALAALLAAVLAILLATAPASAQSVDSARLRPRTAVAERVHPGDVHIDGRLDEPSWQRLLTSPRTRIGDFTAHSPLPGTIPHDSTIAAIAFDDDAVYVAVRAYDSHPDSIVAPFMRRDDESRADWLFVELDTRHDRRNAFSLGVNPRGVQVDGVWIDDVGYDYAWNGVWQARTRVDSLGWTAEFRIPFSQLRSAASSGDDRLVTWGLNIYRNNAHHSSSSDWAPRLPSHGGRVVSHFNDLVGIELPRSSHAFELTPYLSSQSSPHSALVTGSPSTTHPARASAGGDVVAHLPSGLTLDATIRPDFGQVEADPSQINLTTFETFQAERRPFFVNGGDLFHYDLGIPFTSRGDAFDSEQAFYTRRIGAPPRGSVPNSAIVADVPLATDVLAAAKISGRIAGGWTVGALAAQSASTDALYLDASGRRLSTRVEPRTLAAATRIIRDFRNGGSAIGVFADIADAGSSDAELDTVLPRRSMFGGLDARHRMGGYEASAMAGASMVDGDARALARTQLGPGHFLGRLDAGYAKYDSTATSITGAIARVKYAKIDGAFTWSATGYAVSPTFDVGAAGFQRNADWLVALASASYHRDLDSTHRFRSWTVSTDGTGLGWSWGGERRSVVTTAAISGELWNYRGGSLSLARDGAAGSVELLRGGPIVYLPSRWSASASAHSDSRESTTLALGTSASRSAATGSWSAGASPSVTSRLSDRLSANASADVQFATDGVAYLAELTDASSARRWTVASLHSHSLSLVARADYSFSANVTLQGYLQPYFGAGRYDNVKIASVAGTRAVLAPLASRATRMTDGAIGIDLQDGAQAARVSNPDYTVRELHGSAVLRWEYLPGSEVYVVWTQSRSGADTAGALRLGADARELFSIAPRNVFLVKLSYRIVP